MSKYCCLFFVLICFLSNINLSISESTEIYYAPKSLSELTAKYILDNNIAYDSVDYYSKEYIDKIKEINMRVLPDRLKELFLSIAFTHSTKSIINALELIDKIDQCFSKEESNLIKDQLSFESPEIFSLDPSVSILLLLPSNIIENIFKEEVNLLKTNYIEILQKDEDNLKAKIVLFRIYFYIDKNLEISAKMLDNIKNFYQDSNNIFYYLTLLITKEEEIKINYLKEALNHKSYEAFSILSNLKSSLIKYFSKTELKHAINKYEKMLIFNRFNFIRDYLILARLYLLINEQDKAYKILENVLNKRSKEISHSLNYMVTGLYISRNQTDKITDNMLEIYNKYMQLSLSISNKVFDN